MTIERIESTERMSRIVKHNGTVYLCGQTAGEAEWDITEQTQRCLDKTIYVRDMKDFAAMNAVWDAWVADCEKPARACVEARMARPQILVEFTVTAAYS